MSARSVGVDPGLGRLSLPADHVAPARIPTEAELHQFVAEPESRRHHVWIAVVLACLLLGGGLFGSQLAAASVAKRNSERSQQALELSAVEIASKLRLSLQRQEDLAISAAAFFLARPFASNDQFRAWADTMHAFQRYPELLGWGHVVMITQEHLLAYPTLAAADPAPVVSGTFEVIPPGDRPFYCFLVAGQARVVTQGVPPGFDYCAGDGGVPILSSRDSGLSSYQSLTTPNGVAPSLSVQVPIYTGGLAHTTVETRRAAFAGWVGLAFDAKVLLDNALLHHAGTAVTLRFDDGASKPEFTSGPIPDDATGKTIELGNGWTVATFATVVAPGILDDKSALTVLLVGIAASFVLAALVLVLGTGRASALRLVGERTEELRHQAMHDALTGLPNRKLIMDRIEQLLTRNRRNDTSGAALYIDLDDFKNINDTLGHEAGDRLLVAVAARLTSALRDVDTIGRMGGDEFVVLIDGAPMKLAPDLIAERLLDVMRQPFDLDDTSIPLSVNTSIGIAVGDRETGGDLLRDADVALYQAKAAGKNRYEIFFPEMQTEISRRIELEFDLRSAIDRNQLRLVYQPIYNLDDLSLVGVEALLRWDHPVIGVVEPDEFIPILEQTGQIQEVGRWVLLEACAQMASWHAKGDTLDISVNVSGRQLDRDDIIDNIREALSSSGLDPARLIIEVTETALMRDAADTAVRLNAIKALGVRIAVDDFGTGYSSLAYLQQFPVDCIKIDRRFTSAISVSPESKALIRTLVQLGRDLGLKTLAEGVETTLEMDHLRGERVNQAQGFLLSRPLAPQMLEAQILAPARTSPQASTTS